MAIPTSSSRASRGSRRSAASRTTRTLDPTLARGLDFRNDTEVHVIARGKSEESGLEYGATIEFEADTNNTSNTDETWIFLRGGWGEIRLGDEDGVVDNSVVGGQTLAAGTGGIDGSDAVIAAAPLVFLSNSNDATKVRYYTPSFGGLSLGVSYTPTQENFNSGANNGQFFANKDGALAMDGQNIFEGALAYNGDLGGVGILASVVGLYGELKNDAEDLFGDDKWWGIQTGANVDLFGFRLGGSVGHDEVGETQRDFFTAGIGATLGPVNTSITYGQIFNTNSDFDEATGIGDKAYNVVFSADVPLAPGLVLAGDVSKFDNDATPRLWYRRQGLDRGGQRPPGVLIVADLETQRRGLPRRFAFRPSRRPRPQARSKVCKSRAKS